MTGNDWGWAGKEGTVMMCDCRQNPPEFGDSYRLDLEMGRAGRPGQQAAQLSHWDGLDGLDGRAGREHQDISQISWSNQNRVVRDGSK